jgi:hypothetical protein
MKGRPARGNQEQTDRLTEGCWSTGIPVSAILSRTSWRRRNALTQSARKRYIPDVFELIGMRFAGGKVIHSITSTSCRGHGPPTQATKHPSREPQFLSATHRCARWAEVDNAR